MGSPGSLGLITGLTGLMGGAQENLLEPMAPVVGGSRAAGLLKGGHRETDTCGRQGLREGRGTERGAGFVILGRTHTLGGGGQTAEVGVAWCHFTPLCFNRCTLVCVCMRERQRQRQNAREIQNGSTSGEQAGIPPPEAHVYASDPQPPPTEAASTDSWMLCAPRLCLSRQPSQHVVVVAPQGAACPLLTPRLTLAPERLVLCLQATVLCEGLCKLGSLHASVQIPTPKLQAGWAQGPGPFPARGSPAPG